MLEWKNLAEKLNKQIQFQSLPNLLIAIAEMSNLSELLPQRDKQLSYPQSQLDT